MPLNVGDRLAHYDVTALIGEGGMGQVYQATDTKLNRRVDGRGVVMSQIRVLVALVVVSAAGFGWVSAQPRGGDPRALTGQDYGEIENLYARYSQGSDFQNAELFLSAFSEDATIVRADGSSIQDMTALRAERVERYQGRTGDVGRRHRTGSYLLTPPLTDSDPPSEELMFNDPDGIPVQIQDVSYCGGSGVLGNLCDPDDRPRSR